MIENCFDDYFRMFKEFAAEYDEDDAAPLRLKTAHTFRVFGHAAKVVEELGLDVSQEGACMPGRCAGRASLLAALFHDCGRYPQYRRYGTFVDAASENHAELSLATVRERNFFMNEQPETAEMACTAIRLHNRHELPVLSDAARLAVDIVRDADKLDILKIMAGMFGNALPEKDAVVLHVGNDPSKWTPLVAETVASGRTPRYTDLRFANDFRLLLGAWMHELRFDATKAAVARSGVMDAVLAGLPEEPDLKPALDVLEAELGMCRECMEGRAE